MATQTYCTVDDLESILSDQGVLRLLDDDEDGVAAADESARLDDVIVQAASMMNMRLSFRYDLASLANNDWCRWCNAYMAAQLLMRRRGNPGSPVVFDQADEYRESLKEIREGRLNVPDAAPYRSPEIAVSNYTLEPARRQPVRVRVENSTRPTADGIKRDTAWPFFGWW
ncbi:MAG: hypothetical protein ACIALR_05480 [Blastopirellula sp. JB062]